MLAEPTERRSSKRFTVEADRAEVVVDFDRTDHRAIISDTSATGFGLLLLRGSQVAPGSQLRMIDAGTKTVFELEVVHVRREESFLYVGLRRVSCESPHSVPLFRFAGYSYNLKMPGASPLIFIGVVFGFSFTCITLVELISGAPGHSKQTPNSVHEQALIDARQRLSPAEKRQRLLERSRRNRTNQLLTRQNSQTTASLWEQITGPNREQVGRLVGDRNISWNELVTQLNLSQVQQKRIQGLLDSNDPEKVQAARTRMMTLLTAEQRSAFNQLLATLPLN